MMKLRWGIAIALLLLFSTQLALVAADNVVFIFDASNSMNKPFDGTATRFDIAVEAMAELLSELPTDINAGLLLYGWRVDKVNQIESCKDLELVYPIQPLTSSLRIQMRETLAAIHAQGLTPLADSLVKAASAFSGLQGENAVILLSDGEGNCGGNHAAAAHYLASFDPQIKLHVVGLDLEPEARETLQMMVDITGGTYRGIREAKNLLGALYQAAVGGPVEVVSLPTAAVSDSVAGVPAEYAHYGITNIIRGTSGNDVLYGTEQNDLIYGFEGNDFIIGYGGNDVLIGGSGDDIIEGLEGHDLILGEEGDDTLLGGSGDDQICGGTGQDSIEGEAGNDCLDGGPDDDCVLGGSGNNWLVLSSGNDVLLEGTISQTPCPDCSGAIPCGMPQQLPSTCETPCNQTPAPIQMVAAPPAPCEPLKPTCPAPTPQSSGGCVNPAVIKAIDEGTSLQLHGFVNDEDCDIVSVLWSVEKGSLSDPTSLDPMYYAPMTNFCEGEEVLVRLVATDSCGATGEDCFLIQVDNVNHAPIADAGPDICVDEGSTVQLTCSGSDPDGDPVTYSWCVVSGRGSFSNPSVLHPMFTAPMTSYCEGEDVVLSLTVTDNCGLSTTDTMVVRVRNLNRPPMADAGPDICVDEGSTVQLTCSGSDPDGDPVTYSWCVVSGRGSFSNPSVLHPMFTAPMTSYCEGEDVVLSLIVTDNCGLSTTDTMVVRVRNLNRPPMADAGPDICVDEGSTVQLTCSGSDPDGDPVTYSWCVVSGRGSFSNPSVLHPMFTAPMTSYCEGEDVVLSLTVTDNCGLSTTDTMVVRVRNLNRPPMADAGPDICVNECATIQLVGSASDPDGDPIVCMWRDTSGRGTFSNSNALCPMFTAPPTSECDGEQIVLTLTVTDSCGLSTTDSVVVYINNVNKPPSVVADP